MKVTFSFVKKTPATFRVIIPWDLPGFTELLDESPDQPRNQIGAIVNQVKAAGVWAEVVFDKRLREVLDPQDTLDFEYTDRNFPESLDTADQLSFGGTFDLTGFDYSTFE